MDSEFELELRRLAQAEERGLHDELLSWARDRAIIQKWSDVHVDFQERTWDGEEYPKPDKIVWKQTGQGHIPDLTGVKNGVLHIVEAKRRGAFYHAETADQLRLFSAYAKQVGGKFELYVDGDAEDAAKQFIRAHGIVAEVVVSDGRYQYEYWDAVDADCYRDLD